MRLKRCSGAFGQSAWGEDLLSTHLGAEAGVMNATLRGPTGVHPTRSASQSCAVPNSGRVCQTPSLAKTAAAAVSRVWSWCVAGAWITFLSW